jgi:polysaccharide export outer membrane protein
VTLGGFQYYRILDTAMNLWSSVYGNSGVRAAVSSAGSAALRQWPSRLGERWGGAPGYSAALYTRKRYMFRKNFPKNREVFLKRAWVLIVLSFMLATILAAAASAQPAPPKPIQDTGGVAPDAAKPLPGLNDPGVTGAQVDLGSYVIGANDTLSIELFGHADYSKLYPIRTDGILTIPHFGDVKADGLTPLQLKKVLTEMFASEMRDPDVTVTVWDVRSKKYTVTGSVKKSGSYPLIHTTRVFEALNDAGGFLDNFSNQKDILILRGKDTFHFSYRDFLKGKNRDKNITLENGDTIVVR